MTESSVDVETYRRFSEDIAAPIALLATRVRSWDLVIPVDSFLDVSYDPPTMLVSLYTQSRASEAVADSGSLCLNILAADQDGIAERFAEPGLPLQGMLVGVEHDRDERGNARIAGCLVSMSLSVVNSREVATHTLFECAVTGIKAGSGRKPLVRFSKHWLGFA